MERLVVPVEEWGQNWREKQREQLAKSKRYYTLRFRLILNLRRECVSMYSMK